MEYRGQKEEKVILFKNSPDSSIKSPCGILILFEEYFDFVSFYSQYFLLPWSKLSVSTEEM